MPETGPDTSIRTIVPVILAHHEMRALWPWSVPGRPFPYNNPPGEPSPLEALLGAIETIEAFDRPQLVVSPLMLDAAVGLVRKCISRPPRIITVPAETGSGVPAVIAALETARESRNSVLVFLPASLAIKGDLRAYLQRLAELAAISGQSGYTIVSAERAPPHCKGLLLQSGGNNAKTGLLDVESCLLADAGDAVELAREQRALWMVNGPVIAVVGRVLEMVSTLNPTLLQACQNALRLGRSTEIVLHPDQNFLSLVPDRSVGRILAGHARSMLIDQSGSSVKVLRSWADFAPGELAKYAPPSPKIGTAGLPDHVIVEGPGGILVAARGCEKGTEACFGAAVTEPDDRYRIVNTERGSRPRPWGTEEVVEMTLGVAILRLEIGPGAATERECHVHRCESWVVAGGRGTIWLDGATRQVQAGDHIAIPRGTVHSLRNSGLENLVVYETRTGAIVNDEDRIGLRVEDDRATA